MPSDLRRLLCGAHPDTGPLPEVLHHLGETIDGLVEHTLWILRQPSADVAAFGPFIGRSLMEAAFTAVIARLDPFRILILRQVQSQPNYDLADVYGSSIHWLGDVLCKDPPPQDLWSPKHDPSKMTRAMLADYCDHVLWRPAFILLLDRCDPDRGGPWFDQLRTLEPDGFVAFLRQEARRLYTSLSKGIHIEFVIPASTRYDIMTVTDLLHDATKLAGLIGLLANLVVHIPFAIDLGDALQCFERLQEWGWADAS